MSSPKFIIPITGPLMKYRLDIIKEVSPNIKDYLIIFTDKFSYNLYEEYHDFFNFVLMDDYRNKNSFSLEHELLPPYTTEEEFIKKFSDFYNDDTGTFYPWEINRFIFPYLIEKNILNFVITQSDFIFQNNPAVMEEFFNSIQQNTFCSTYLGRETYNSDRVWSKIQHKFPELELKYDNTFQKCDGFFRGFHFNNTEDMKLFYDIWNEAIKFPILEKIRHTAPMFNGDFIVPFIMQCFAKQRNYNFCNAHDVIFIKRLRTNIGIHYTRAEDTIYMGPRDTWHLYNFDYSDISTISSFIKNNKQQLIDYYAMYFDTTITDSHVYTRIR